MAIRRWEGKLMAGSKRFFIVAAALWALAAAHSWLKFFSGILGYPLWSLFVFAASVLAVYSCGRFLINRFELESQNKLLDAALACSLGLAALCCGVFALGVLRLLYPVCAVLLLGLFLWLGRDRLAWQFPDWQWTRSRVVIACGVLLAISFFAAFMPVHQYDSLVYHMQLPEIYALRHRLAAVPENMYSHFPQNAEMLFTFSLLLKSDILAQLFSWFAVFNAALWLAALANFSPAVRGLAVFMTLSHTALMLLGATTYVEGFMCLWTTAAVICFIKWKELAGLPFSGRWLVLSGLFCGVGLGTKYYGAIPAVILFLLGLRHAFSLGWFSARRAALVQLAVFCAAAFALFLPWGVKNIIEVRNPVFPFFYNLFPNPAFSAAEAKGYFQILTEYGHEGGFLGEFFRFPYLAFANPARFGGGMDVLGSLGWELVFAGVPLIAYAAYKNRAARFLAAYLALHWLVWLATGKVLRFLVVLVPLASLLIAEGFDELRRNAAAPVKTVLFAGLALFTFTRLVSFAYVQNVFETPKVLCGVETRKQYLSRRLDYYPCASAANLVMGEGSKVLLAGEQRSYYINGERIQTTVFKPNDYVVWANQSANASDLAGKIKAAGITHIISVPREAERIKNYETLNFTDSGRENWREFLGMLPLVYETPYCSLHEVK